MLKAGGGPRGHHLDERRADDPPWLCALRARGCRGRGARRRDSCRLGRDLGVRQRAAPGRRDGDRDGPRGGLRRGCSTPRS
jgi:hypothetical protein